MTTEFERLRIALKDRYLVERELGAGGMATVYLADDLKHHRQVAIKVLKQELAVSVGGERFLREIELAAMLNHPHILPLYDSGETEGLLYYVMPYVEGESLRELLDREKQLSLEQVLRYTQEVADGLTYAHAQGIIHRDVKPGNILLYGGHAVLADFGVARALSLVSPTSLTESGTAVGTLAYMSPEQACGREVDASTDTYALGCVVYEMLAGETPYTGPTPAAALARKLVEPVPSLRLIRDTIPAGVERAIVRALARVPADRFATPLEFIKAMERAAVPSSAAGKRSADQAPLIESLVVLPLDNLSGDPDQEYFVEGMQGEQGPRGEQGLQGERGPQGLQGESGHQGEKGIQGPIGPEGPVGPQGPAGDLPSLEALQGVSCDNGAGSVLVSISSGGDVSLKCWYGCTSGQTVCSPGSCVDLMTDKNNCGTCGNVCGSSQTCNQGICESPPPSICEAPDWADPEAIAIANLLNETRQQAGLGCLQFNQALTQAAYAHAAYMLHNSYFGHEEVEGTWGFTGVYFWDRATAAGYTGGPAGEFVVGVDCGIQGAQMWLDSPQHLEYLLTPGWQGIGVGSDGNYCDAMFGYTP
jgi:serine/threonine protein kinase/uncharacterized protein YkwD